MSVETQDADKLRNLTEMAKQMVAQASATGNVLRIPDVIEKFVPKRVGHVEHQSAYRLDF